MPAAIIGFLTALPQILSLIQALMAWINKLSNGDPISFIVKAGDAFNQLANAKTQQEHADAAKSLSDLIASMPRGK